MNSFGWLHLTDFHQGMGEQRRLWPALRQVFFDDLEEVVKKVGEIHVVFFTGDLVQRGTRKEFQAFDKELGLLEAHLARLGSNPRLVFVPGNHDLIRPTSLTAALRELEDRGLTEDAVRRDLYGDLEKPGEHRKAIAKAFSEYQKWWRTKSSAPLREGRLPGDFCLEFHSGDLHIGIVGLNSASTQLHGGDYSRRLAVDIAQVNAVCNGDAPGWARQQDVTFLLTHHPASWLSTECAEHFRTEIAPHFHVHLHGHLHEGDVAPGWAPRGGMGLLSVQGRSLFGLEYVGDPASSKIERSHGYVAGLLERRVSGVGATVRLWPRTAIRLKGQGGWSIAADSQYNPDEGGATEPFHLRMPRVSRAAVGTSQTPASGVPIGLRPPIFVPIGSSSRLDAAADEILSLLDRGARVVALRGAPGDGKTQVLRQLAVRRRGYYVELGDHPNGEMSLREALSIVVESFGEPPCAERSLKAICATVRRILYAQTVDPLLVLDAVDAPCMRAVLESLLDAQFGGAVVVAGPGAAGVAEVHLKASDLKTFERVFDEARPGEPALSQGERDELEKVGAAVEYSPIHAQILAEAARGRELPAAFLEYRNSAQSGGIDADPRLAGPLEKIWKHLAQKDRMRVSLVAVLGDPGVPSSWLPEEFGLAGISRAPLLAVSVIDRAPHLEAHRTVAGFAKRTGSAELIAVLSQLLDEWAGQDGLLDELKARGARSRALVRVFRYLAELGKRADSPRVMKAYLDATYASTSSSLFEHISLVAPDARAVAALPLEVVGELAEQIPPWLAKEHSDLVAIRNAAVDRIVTLVRSKVRPMDDDTAEADGLASALHHGAKALLRGKVEADFPLALSCLQELEARCETLIAINPTKHTILVDLAQVRLQLARSTLLNAAERVDSLRDALKRGGAALPTYLRLAIISAMLGLQREAGLARLDQLELLRTGLALCSAQTIIETQASFLRTAVGICDQTGADPDTWKAVAAVATSLVPPLVQDVLGDKGVAALGHAIVKGAAIDASRSGAELVLTALALYDLPVEEADVAVLTRLAAALREIGFSVLALPIAHAFYARTPGYFEAFELAKALRASGSYVDALAIVDAERARQRMEPNSAQNIAALGDEFVKSAIRVPARSAEIPRVLAESAATYRAANLPVYAERCERWGDNLRSPILAEGGLAEDEWRASIRAEQLSTIEKEQAYALGQRALARVLLLTRSG